MENIKTKWDDIFVLIDLGEEEEDFTLLKEIENEIKSLKDNIKKLQLEILLKGKYDVNNAKITGYGVPQWPYYSPNGYNFSDGKAQDGSGNKTT